MGRLKTHLLHAERCRRLLIGRGHNFNLVGGSGSIEDRDLALSHDGLLPPLQGEGPSLDGALVQEGVLQDLILGEDIYLALLDRSDRTDAATIVDIIKEKIQSRPISWTMTKLTLD